MDYVFSKIFSMIDIDKINSKEEFDCFIENLINCPGPLREACAYKLEDFDFDEYLDRASIDIILFAITDINPNVSRCVCKVISKSDKLKNILAPCIIEKIDKILTSVSEEDKKQNIKSHTKNKIFFSLYWLMEALYCCNINEFVFDIIKILQNTISFCDYTIREKTAKLLSKIPNPPNELAELVKSDPNFYVNFYAKYI